MPAELACFEERCRARFPITELIYNCPRCGGLLEAVYDAPDRPAADWKRLWRERRMSNAPLDQSGVWRYREFFPFLDSYDHVVTLREGNTPLLDAPAAARYGGLDRLTFKHQGFNPTGSFKDNGMTCGTAQALRLGCKRVACVSTGNTSASMAAYASAAGLQPVIFIPNGNISYGKLAQALEYGARTLQVEANFDQILALVRQIAEKLGIYLLNSINPFRIEGQKTIMVELMDQRDWSVPDWVVLPGGNLGNTSAFGKALREMKEWGLISRLPRLAVIQAEGAAPFYDVDAQRGPLATAARRASRDARHRHQNRRSRLLAQSAARGMRFQRSGRESHRAGDCGRQGHHRPLRDRLRARLCSDSRRNPKPGDRGRRETRGRCGRRAHGQRLERP